MATLETRLGIVNNLQTPDNFLMATRASAGTGHIPVTPHALATLGMIVPYDFALDRELWRWAPPEVTLHLTRTRWSSLPVGVEQAREVGAVAEVAMLARDVAITTPGCAVYACTSGSFVRGLAGERALVEAMRSAGFPAAVTTSGALLQALEALGTSRVAVATPYDEPVTAALGDFLAAAGHRVAGSSHLGLSGRIWTVSYAETAALVRQAVTADCDVVFVSCTNLATYDLVPALEAELGLPVLTANQVTMWAALRTVGMRAVGVGALLALS